VLVDACVFYSYIQLAFMDAHVIQHSVIYMQANYATGLKTICYINYESAVFSI